MSEGPGANTGHGYVWKRPDGMQAKCGGPSICLQCARDFARMDSIASELEAWADSERRLWADQKEQHQ